MMETNKINSVEELINCKFSDNVCIVRQTRDCHLLIFWNSQPNNECDQPNINIKSNNSKMKFPPLFYVIVSLEDNLSLNLITYNRNILDSITICDINKESELIVNFIQRLSTLKLCEGVRSPPDNKLNTTALCSLYLIEQLNSQVLFRSRQCRFGITDGKVCEICKSMSEKTMETFELQSNDDSNKDTFKCEHCPFQTNNPKMFRTHAKIGHSKSKPFMCQKCPFSSNKYLSIMKHVERAHEKTKDQGCREKIQEDVLEPIKPYTCEYICRHCKFKTTKSGAITKHIRKAHEVKEPYKCEFCTKTFTNSGIMNVHVRSVHLKEKRYKCQDCSYESYVKHSVTKHIKYVHDKIRSYNCEYCTFAATTKSVLECHIKRVHEKIKPFSCLECSFKAATNYHLKRHILSVHEKLKPYKCNQCEYKAAVSGNLSLHIKHVHEKIKEHKCQYCPFETTRKAKLLEHVSDSHSTVIQVVENIHTIVEGHEGIQIPIEGIELKFIDKAPR